MIQAMLLILSPINRFEINDKYPSAPLYGFLHQPPTPPTNKQQTLLDCAHTIVTGIDKVQDTAREMRECRNRLHLDDVPTLDFLIEESGGVNQLLP